MSVGLDDRLRDLLIERLRDITQIYQLRNMQYQAKASRMRDALEDLIDEIMGGTLVYVEPEPEPTSETPPVESQEATGNDPVIQESETPPDDSEGPGATPEDMSAILETPANDPASEPVKSKHRRR